MINDAHSLACFSYSHVSIWSPLRNSLWLKHILTEIACTRDGALVCMFFDEFGGKLNCWVWVWATLNFVWKQRMSSGELLFPNTPYDWHLLGHLCIKVLCQWKEHVSWSKPIDVLCFDAVNAVFVFSWMVKRRPRNKYCPAFASWPSSFVCLHLLTMVDSSGWLHSFVHISIPWA